MNSILAQIVSKTLEPFVEGLDTNQVNLSLLRGKVSLSNLTLKKESLFTALGLQLEVISSQINSIELDVPWMSLFTDHVKVKVSGVTIQVGPRSEATGHPLSSGDPSANKKRKNFNLQEINKLKKEALKHTEESYLPLDKKKMPRGQNAPAAEDSGAAYLSFLSGMEVYVSNISVVYFHENSQKDLIKFHLKLDAVNIVNSANESYSWGWNKLLKKKLQVLNLWLSLDFLDQLVKFESDSKEANRKEFVNSNHSQNHNVHEKEEEYVITHLYCDMDWQGVLGENVDMSASLHIKEFLCKLSQKTLLGLWIHSVNGSAQSETLSLEARQLSKLRPLMRLQYLVNRVLKKFNFKRRVIEQMLEKFRYNKTKLYVDLYTKVANKKASKDELALMERLEDYTALTELIRLRKAVLERKQIMGMGITQNINIESLEPFEKSDTWHKLLWPQNHQMGSSGGEGTGRLSFDVKIEIERASIVFLESALMEMNHEINLAQKVAIKKGINQERQNEHMEELVAKYTTSRKDLKTSNGLLTCNSLAQLKKQLSKLYWNNRQPTGSQQGHLNEPGWSSSRIQEHSAPKTKPDSPGGQRQDTAGGPRPGAAQEPPTNSQIFALVLTLDAFQATYSHKQGLEDKADIRFGEFKCIDWDFGHIHHNHIFVMRSSSHLVFQKVQQRVHADCEKSFEVNGRLGAVSVSLCNSTFQRLWAFYQYMYNITEIRQRTLQVQNNRHSLEFFRGVFDVVFTDNPRLFTFDASVSIPEVNVFFPSQNQSQDDMLKISFKKVHLHRTDGLNSNQEGHDNKKKFTHDEFFHSRTGQYGRRESKLKHAGLVRVDDDENVHVEDKKSDIKFLLTSPTSVLVENCTVSIESSYGYSADGFSTKEDIQDNSYPTHQRTAEHTFSYLGAGFKAESQQQKDTNEFQRVIIMRTDKVQFFLKAQLHEAKMPWYAITKSAQPGIYRRPSSVTKVFRSREILAATKMPPLDITISTKTLEVLTRLEENWSGSFPTIHNEVLEALSSNITEKLFQDKIFLQYRFTPKFLMRLHNHVSASLDITMPSIKINLVLKAGSQGTTIFLEQLQVTSLYGYYSDVHKLHLKNLLVLDNDKKVVLVRNIAEAGERKFSADPHLEVYYRSNNQYLIEALKRLRDLTRHSHEAEHMFLDDDDLDEENDDKVTGNLNYQVNLLISANQRLFLQFDPDAYTHLHQILASYRIAAKKRNHFDVLDQILSGDRIRSFVWRTPDHLKPKGSESTSGRSKDMRFDRRTAVLDPPSKSGSPKHSRPTADPKWLKFVLNLNQGAAIQFVHKSRSLYTLFTPQLKVRMHSRLHSASTTEVELHDPRLLDSSEYGAKHSSIIKSQDGAKPGRIEVVFATLPKDKATQLNYSTYLGVKLERLRLNLLKRRVQEMVEYFRKHVLFCLTYTTSWEIPSKQYFENLSHQSDIHIEVLASDLVVAVPRSSLSGEGFMLRVAQLGVWSVGKWGSQFTDLLKTGNFDNTFLVHKRYYDALDEKDLERVEIHVQKATRSGMADPAPKVSGTRSRRYSGIGMSLKDGFKVFLTPIKIKFTTSLVNLDVSADSFETNSSMETGDYTHISINYNMQLRRHDMKEPIPMQGNLRLTIVIVEMGKLLFVAYEDSYQTLVNVMHENFREAPFLCTSNDPTDYLSEKYWFNLQLCINQILLKGFSGSSLSVIVNKTGKVPFGSRNGIRYPEGWNLKNLQSLLALRIQKMVFDIFMKENGGNTKIIKLFGLEILDYRINSKLKHQKRVFFSTRPADGSKSEDHSKHKFSMDMIAEKFTSAYGKLESCDQLVKLNEEETDKITKLNLIKKEMFNKYFSKDDFMNSIVNLVCTTNDSDGLGSESVDVELGNNFEQDKHSTDAKGASSLKNESSSQGPKPEVPKTKESKPEEKKSWFSNCWCCSKKKKIAEDTKESKSVQVSSADIEISGEPQESPNLRLDELKQKELREESEKQQQSEQLKPSQRLLDRFKLKEVPWLIKKMNQTRAFKDPSKLEFEVTKEELEIDLKDSDFSLEMNVTWEGQTDIRILSSKKTVLVVPDLLMEVLTFLKKPFSSNTRCDHQLCQIVALNRFHMKSSTILHP